MEKTYIVLLERWSITMFVSIEYRFPLSCLITREQKEQTRSKHNGHIAEGFYTRLDNEEQSKRWYNFQSFQIFWWRIIRSYHRFVSHIIIPFTFYYYPPPLITLSIYIVRFLKILINTIDFIINKFWQLCHLKMFKKFNRNNILRIHSIHSIWNENDSEASKRIE